MVKTREKDIAADNFHFPGEPTLLRVVTTQFGEKDTKTTQKKEKLFYSLLQLED